MNTNSEEPDDKLIQYLDGELNGEELDAFEKLLARDPLLTEKLRSFELARQVVQHYGLKQQVSTVHGTMMAELRNDPSKLSGGRVYPFIRITMRVAASLLLLCVLFSVYQFMAVSSSKLAQDGYHTYDLSVTRGEETYSIIERSYLDKNFTAVIRELSKSTSPTVNEHFLGGQAYLVTHQPAKAIDEFKRVVGDQSATYKEDAEYYLGISYLQNDQPEKAKTLFEKIYLDKDHLYHDQVTMWTMFKLRLLLIKDPGR